MSLGSIIQPGKRFLRYSPTIHRTTVSSRPAASLPQLRSFSYSPTASIHRTTVSSRPAASLPQLRSFSSATPNPHELFPSTAFYRITPSTVCEVLSHDLKAASLTKALYIDCLPPSVYKAEPTKEFHKTLKQTLLESFFFTPAHRHVPETKNRKSNVTIMECFYSNVLKYLYTKVDSSRCKIMVDREPYFQHPFYRALPDQDKPEPILIDGHLTYHVLSDTPASPLFTVEECLESRDHPLEWDDVISPVLGYEQISLPDNIIPGSSSASLPKYPYTRVILDIGGAGEWSDTSRARGIYFLFARLASEAIRDGYEPGDVLDTPRVGVFISGSAYSFHFVFFQLNTLDLLAAEGVKNLSWGQSVDNITTNLLPMKKVEPENLLGPAVLEEVADFMKTALFYDLPVKNEVFVE